MKTLSLIILIVFFNMSAALGHEFWITPEIYEISDGADIVADLRGGQKFSGGSFGFLPPRFERFDLVQGDRTVPVEGRAGDRPALNMAVPDTGLWIIVHETKDSRITWKEWEKFSGFVEHKQLGNALAVHRDRGLPETGFRERYRRFAKSLVAVGNGAGSDRSVGLLTEIVALANPYRDELSGKLPVQVLFEDAPRIDAQIEIFEKDSSGTVIVSTVQTDMDGKAIIAVKPGHEYLLDAVVLLPLEAADVAKDPVWESLWAALTFRIPDN